MVIKIYIWHILKNTEEIKTHVQHVSMQLIHVYTIYLKIVIRQPLLLVQFRDAWKVEEFMMNRISFE